MRSFQKDLATGKAWEAELLSQLPGAVPLGRTERHLGDFCFDDVFIEAKLDERGMKTGNAYLELLDWDAETMFLTGVAKHSTQEGRRLVVHRIGEEALVYEPTPALAFLSGLITTKKGKWVTQRNGWGETGGIVSPVSHLSTIPAFVHIAIADVTNTVSDWSWQNSNPVTEEFVARYISHIADPAKIPFHRNLKVKK